MRILITTGIFPPDIGGPATYVPKIAKGLSERGHKVEVLTLSDHIGHDDRNYPFRVIRLSRKIFKPWRWLRTIVSIIKLARGADILFVNGLAMEAALANLLMRKPMVQKVVGDLAWERAAGKGWMMDTFEIFQKSHYDLRIESLKKLRTWWTRKADRVIVPSCYLAEWIAKWGIPKERIQVIYNAFEQMDGIVPAVVPLQTPLKAVTVGRLVSWKRIDQVLEAVTSVWGLGLVIVGDGPERLRLVKLASSLGISDRVYFAGACSRKETLRLMAASDVFILNSTYEGLPHVVLEAMALGLTVVATAVGGTPELVQNGYNGILIEPREDSLRKVLQQLLRDKTLRMNLSINARSTVKKFSLSGMIEYTESVLLRLIEGQNQ